MPCKQPGSKQKLFSGSTMQMGLGKRKRMQSMCLQCPKQVLGGCVGTRLSRCVGRRHYAA